MISSVVRHVITPALERTFHRRTMEYYRQLQESQWWPADRLRAQQLEKLRALVGIAMDRTPWYAEFSGLGHSWRPESLENLRRLPLLDKTVLSRHRDALTNRDVEGGPIRYRTGGSTGQPLIFHIDRRRQAYDKAARMRSHDWFGCPPGTREAYIWNSPVELTKQDRAKHLRDWLTNERLFPASELSEASIERFVEGLERFRPQCLFGYPSAMSLLCRLAHRACLRLDALPVRAVFSTAEVLYDHQRELLSASFGGVPVANGYGSREAGFVSHECPEGRMHVTSENVIVEVLRDGEPVVDQEGEIVVTQLDNHAMPFLRYRTYDVGQLSSQPCPCGRGLEVMTVVKGRSNDFLIAPDGRRIHSSAVHAAISGIPGIDNFQLLQEPDGLVRVLLVTDEQFPPDGERRLMDGLRERLGPQGRLRLERTQSIPPGPSGKHRYVISQVAGHDGSVGPRTSA